MRQDATSVRVPEFRPARAALTAGRLASAVSALLAVVLVAVTLGAVPAWAAPVKNPWPVAECIVQHANGTFQAVFGYEKGSNPTVIPIGANNSLSPSELNGVQPTSFEAGRVRAVFATAAVPITTRVTWSLFSRTATATRWTSTCGPEVSLPGEGNGIGAVLVLTTSVLISVALLRIRQWRQRRRSA